MIWKDGRTYEGEYVNDKMEGKGSLFIPGEGIFNCIWKNGKKNGLG